MTNTFTKNEPHPAISSHCCGWGRSAKYSLKVMFNSLTWSHMGSKYSITLPVAQLVKRSPGEGKGYPLQYSCLENPMDGEAWWATVHGVTKSWTQLSDFTFTFN